MIIHLPDSYQNSIISAHFLFFAVKNLPRQERGTQTKRAPQFVACILTICREQKKGALNVHNRHFNSSHLFWFLA